jgi:uncharacterized protein
MRISRFVVLYRDVGEGEHVLYNVLMDRYAGVDDATLDALDRWRSGEAPRDSNEHMTAELLSEDGFLVADRRADDDRLRRHLEQTAKGVPGTMYITLMPTLVCNLACTYCFQKESPAFNHMAPAVESSTVDWILRRVGDSGCRKLVVHYFGGEPLTRKDYILRTAKTFSAAMAAHAGEFEWEITTNGVQLDLAFVTALKTYGDGSIKITLDGDRETHDQARVYRDGRGSFDIIFSNLVAVAGHARLKVGGNFLPGQERSYERLLDRMRESGLYEKLEAVKFKPVMDTSRSQGGTCTGCSASEAATDTLVQINRSVQSRGLAADGHTLESMLGPCELHWKNSYTIDPDGDVYKCPAVAGRREMAVGSVQSAEPDKAAPLLERRPWEQCGDCPYISVCMGGCLGGLYLKTGRLDQVHCRKDEFEVSFREAITQRYREELGAEEWECVAS